MEQKFIYNVVILGGGLSGLTLAIQLKKKVPDLSILILEKRETEAPIATHKVGESTVELGSFYLRETIALKDYLEKYHIIKFGFRYFFSDDNNSKIENRFEVGSKKPRAVRTHQIDRGILENDLIGFAKELGVEIILGAKVESVDLLPSKKKVDYSLSGNSNSVSANWVVDATGRNSIFKRKLSLEKNLNHDVNAFWFRVKGNLDVDHLSQDSEWRNYFPANQRRLATNHMMGKGYWVWIIPLPSNCTSVGIVAENSLHPFNEINSFSKSVQWLEKYEPNLATEVLKYSENLMDFKVMKHFAHDVTQYFSEEKWAITGEAGSFMDAFYSPGTDFIGLGNSWITDLITRDFQGEDIQVRTLIYESLQKEMVRNWAPLYQNKYPMFGNTQVTLLKLVWDWAAYWGFPTLLFMNDGYININIIKKLFSSKDGSGSKFKQLNQQMQQLFMDWNEMDHTETQKGYLDLFDLNCLADLHHKLTLRFNEEDLMQQANENLEILEKIAAEMMRRIFHLVHQTPIEMIINPYEMTLKNQSVSEGNGIRPDAAIKSDIDMAWLSEMKITA